jgi:hypothetical protein
MAVSAPCIHLFHGGYFGISVSITCPLSLCARNSRFMPVRIDDNVSRAYHVLVYASQLVVQPKIHNTCEIFGVSNLR